MSANIMSGSDGGEVSGRGRRGPNEGGRRARKGTKCTLGLADSEVGIVRSGITLLGFDVF